MEEEEGKGLLLYNLRIVENCIAMFIFQFQMTCRMGRRPKEKGLPWNCIFIFFISTFLGCAAGNLGKFLSRAQLLGFLLLRS